MVEMLGRLRRPPSAEALIARAQRGAGLTDFGDTPFARPLQMLLDACRKEADLSLFGGAAIRWDTVRFLSNLLRLREEEKRNPAILDQAVERPLIIAGLPRSGTTFLHSLLIEDQANLVPRVWQLIHPYPASRSGGRDRRPRQVARQLRLFQLLAPRFRHLHPIEAGSPQECSEITAHLFASLRFDTTYRIPSYRRWLDDTGHLDAYRFHKRFLQHLRHQAGGEGRWVLKCPDHIFALGAIRAVYPDAQLVFVHRDPVAVLASVARLTEVLRRPFSRQIDRIDIGRQDSARWLAAAELMIAAADREDFAAPIFHVHYAENHRRPGRRRGRALSAFRAEFSMPRRRTASAAGWRRTRTAATAAAAPASTITGSIRRASTSVMPATWLALGFGRNRDESSSRSARG